MPDFRKRPRPQNARLLPGGQPPQVQDAAVSDSVPPSAAAAAAAAEQPEQVRRLNASQRQLAEAARLAEGGVTSVHVDPLKRRGAAQVQYDAQRRQARTASDEEMEDAPDAAAESPAAAAAAAPDTYSWAEASKALLESLNFPSEDTVEEILHGFEADPIKALLLYHYKSGLVGEQESPIEALQPLYYSSIGGMLRTCKEAILVFNARS